MRWQKPVKPSGSRSMRSFAAGQLPEAKVRTLYHSGKMINVRTPHWKPATSAHKSHSSHHKTVNSKAVLPSRQPAGLTLTQSRVRPIRYVGDCCRLQQRPPGGSCMTGRILGCAHAALVLMHAVLANQGIIYYHTGTMLWGC